MLFLFATMVAVAQAQSPCPSEVCSQEVPAQAPALLQKGATPGKIKLLDAKSNTSQFSASHVNPSGAAAPLDEEGYAAVADRCCQAEMVEFMRRAASVLDLEVCVDGGLWGLAPYHSCEKGPQTFAQLNSALLAASVERCLWVAPGGGCKAMPEDCADFEGVIPTDCLCSMSNAAKLDFKKAILTMNNLGGLGPDSGPEELRYAGAGTTAAGASFDLVVTTLNAYQVAMKDGDPKNIKNGMKGKFGSIGIKMPQVDFNGLTDFRFSFMQPATNTPVVVPEFHMAVFDLDGVIKGYEQVSSKGYTGYVTDIATTVMASRLPDGRTKFTANPEDGEIKNPKEAMILTAEQRKASVMYIYKDVSSFDLTFGFAEPKFAKGSMSGRNLFFSGESALQDRCAP